jgi:hypothetical protein
MMWLAPADMSVSLILRWSALWTHGSHNHGLLLTSTVWEAFSANSSMESLHEHDMDSTTDIFGDNIEC